MRIKERANCFQHSDQGEGGGGQGTTEAGDIHLPCGGGGRRGGGPQVESAWGQALPPQGEAAGTDEGEEGGGQAGSWNGLCYDRCDNYVVCSTLCKGKLIVTWF